MCIFLLRSTSFCRDWPKWLDLVQCHFCRKSFQTMRKTQKSISRRNFLKEGEKSYIFAMWFLQSRGLASSKSQGGAKRPILPPLFRKVEFYCIFMWQSLSSSASFPQSVQNLTHHWKRECHLSYFRLIEWWPIQRYLAPIFFLVYIFT